MTLDAEKYNQWVEDLEVQLDVDYADDARQIMSIQGKRVCTAGNFIGIIGKSKVGKSTLLTAILRCIDSDEEGIGNIQIDLPLDKPNAVVFDTEQSSFHIQKYAQISVTDNTDQRIRFFKLRPLNPKERIDFIESYLEDHPDIGLVIIDGLRDLLSKGINDESDATNVMAYLMKWTDTYGIALITCLHTNKHDKNARGHVGTELINKAEATIELDRFGDTTNVIAQYSRNKPFEPFAFTINSEGKAIPTTSQRKKPGRQTVQPKELSTYHMKAILDLLKSSDMSAKSVQLMVQKYAKEQSELPNISITQARKIIGRLEQEGFIENRGTDTHKKYNRTTKEISLYGDTSV